MNECMSLKTISKLTWEKVGLLSAWGGPATSFSFSTLMEILGGLAIRLAENISSRVLLTDGKVL